MDAETLAKQARESISSYCIDECHAYCCRKGYLELTSEELKLVSGCNINLLEAKGAVNFSQNETHLLDLSLQNCPSLKDNLCLIHKNPKRPKACKEFPIFIWENNIIHISGRCHAVKQGLLYPYMAKFKKAGFKMQ